MVTRVCENGHEIDRLDLFYCPVCKSVDLRIVDDGTQAEQEEPAPAAAVQAPTQTPSPTQGEPVRGRPALAPKPRSTPMHHTQAARSSAAKEPSGRNKWELQQAQERLKSLLVQGIGLSFAGGFCMGIGLAANSFWGTFLGSVVAWIGTALLSVSLIGYGVKFGREAANV